MNLNKFTKAELISKLQSNKDNLQSKVGKEYSIIIPIKSYLSQIWELILTFKNILLKLTLISFFIRIFKKYKLFRRIWIMLNTIIMSIFGISLLDNFGIEIITNFFNEVKVITYSIVNYLSETNFYQSLAKLFSENKKDIPSSENSDKSGSLTNSNSRETEGNFKKDKMNSKISEWLKPQIEAYEEDFDKNVWEDTSEPLISNKEYQQAVFDSMKIPDISIDDLVDNAPKLKDSELLDSVKDTFTESNSKDSELLDSVKNTSTITKGKEKEILPDISIESDNPNPESQSIIHSAWDNIKTLLTPNITPKASYKDLKPELNPLDELIDKGKKLHTFEDLKDTEKLLLEKEAMNLKPDTLIDKFKDLPDFVENSYISSLVEDNIDETIKKLIVENPGWGKQKTIEKLIQENPNNKDKILSIVSKTLDDQLSIWDSKIPEEKLRKVKKILMKEDLKELESLAENRSIDQIKTLRSVNRSHNNLLHEIKSKASQSSFNTDKLDDTMNLFE